MFEMTCVQSQSFTGTQIVAMPTTTCTDYTAGARVAHCVTGVAAHGNLIDRFPIYE